MVPRVGFRAGEATRARQVAEVSGDRGEPQASRPGFLPAGSLRDEKQGNTESHRGY